MRLVNISEMMLLKYVFILIIYTFSTFLNNLDKHLI